MENNLELALKKRGLRKKLEKTASKLGISPVACDSGILADFLKRVGNNPGLAAALKKARSRGVVIFPSFSFKVDDGSIFVDHRASDKEITDFIMS